MDIRRIGTTYDDIGRVEYVTSYSDTSGTTAVNQIKYEYDSWGKLFREYQEHDGPVDGNTLFVQYDYSDGASGGVAKYVRLDEVTYPNGREVHYDYGATGAIDDVMSRLAAIGDGTNTHAAYKYLGTGTIVEEDYEDIDVKLTYLDANGNPTGLDRFGRVADQVWIDYGADPDAVLDRYTYTYDRAGNRTARQNELNAALDEDYVYDDLDRLIEWKLNGYTQKTWLLDSLGNDLSAGTYNAANEMTPTQGGSAYDAAGNMTTLQSGMTAKYDAWNRLVEVVDSIIVEKNEYDGTNRRIQIFKDFDGGVPGNVLDDFHLGQQVIETRLGAAAAAPESKAVFYQNVWSPRYIDAPILRDRYIGGNLYTAARVFYLADANYNVTGLVKYNSGTTDWEVVERYAYTPYGVATFCDASWNDVGSSANGNTTLYTGRTLDALTNLYYYRARYYDAGLERFVSRDPSGYWGSNCLNLYEYVYGSPTNKTDPTGLQMFPHFPRAVPPIMPPSPTPGGSGANAKRPGSMGYLWTCDCSSKKDRLSPIPGVGTPPKSPIPGTGPSGGSYGIYSFPKTPPAAVGGGGAGPCHILVVKCPGFVAVFHFSVGDSPSRTLSKYSFPSGCSSIICGGDDSGQSNCLGDDVISAARTHGLNVVGVSGNSGCGVDASGDWYQYGS